MSGQSKPVGSGRKAGTRNKRSNELSNILENAGVNLPQKILDLLPTLNPEKQADILIRLMDYVYPKVKSTSIASSSDQASDSKSLVITFVDD